MLNRIQYDNKPWILLFNDNETKFNSFPHNTYNFLLKTKGKMDKLHRQDNKLK